MSPDLPAARASVVLLLEDAGLAVSLVFGAALGGFLGVVFADESAFKNGNELWVSSALIRFSFAACALFWMAKLNLWRDKWLYIALTVFCVWFYRGGAVTMHWAGFNVVPIHVIFLSWIVTIVSISMLEILVIWRVERKK